MKISIDRSDSFANAIDIALDPSLENKPSAREVVWEDLLLKGNAPSWCSELQPITLIFKDSKIGSARKLTFFASVDYLSLGDDDRCFYVPLSPLSAQRLCDRWECMLPTPKMVDLIWQAAAFKLDPKPWGPPYNAEMHSTGRIKVHSDNVEKQIVKLGESAEKRTAIVAGHKKDIVMSNRLLVKPKSVCIYGWTQPNGKPIQPVSTVHENTYMDYAHGVRLVSLKCELDDVQADIREILQDAQLCKLISNEGVLKVLRQPGT